MVSEKEETNQDHVCDPDPDDTLQYYNEEHSPFPAGCVMGGCTSGTPVYNNSTGLYSMVTAAHCYDDTEYIAYQPAPPREVGFIDARALYYNDSSDYPMDAAVIGLDYVEPAYYLADGNGGLGELIRGYRSWEWTYDSQFTNTEIHRQGATTGRCSGDLVSATEFGEGKEVIIDTPRDGGDSGGPYFHRDDGDAYIVAIHRGPVNNDQHAMGPAISYIMDFFDLI